MTPDQWIDELRYIYSSHGANLSTDKSQILLNQIPANNEANDTFAQSLTRIGIGSLESRIPEEQIGICEELIELLHREFFRRISNGETFGDVTRLGEKQRTWLQTSSQKYGDSHRSFFHVIRTLLTFYREVDDVFPAHYDFVISQVLHSFRLEMKGCFFPAPGPYRIPFKQRVQRQRALFDQYAPNFDQDDFFKHNPVLNRLKAEETKLPSIVILVVSLVVAFFVPQQQWWGKIFFWVLMGIILLCLSDLFTFIRRLIFGKRADRIDAMRGLDIR